MNKRKKVSLIVFISSLVILAIGLYYLNTKFQILADSVRNTMILDGRVASFSNSKMDFKIIDGCLTTLSINNSSYSSTEVDTIKDAGQYGVLLYKNDKFIKVSPPKDTAAILSADGTTVSYSWNDATHGPLALKVTVLDQPNSDVEIRYSSEATQGNLAGVVSCYSGLRTGGSNETKIDYLVPSKEGVLLDENVSRDSFDFIENGRLPRLFPALVIGRQNNSAFLLWNAQTPMDNPYSLSFKKNSLENDISFSFYTKSYSAYPWDDSKVGYNDIPWRMSAKSNWLEAADYYSLWQRNQLKMVTLAERLPAWARSAVIGFRPVSSMYENEGRESGPVYTDGRNKFLANIKNLANLLGKSGIYTYLSQSSSINFKRDQQGNPHVDQLTAAEREQNSHNFYNLIHGQIMSNFIKDLRSNGSRVIIYVFNGVSYYNNPIYAPDKGVPYLRDLLYPNGTIDLEKVVPSFVGNEIPTFSRYSWYQVNPAYSAIRNLMVENLTRLINKEQVDGAYFDAGFGFNTVTKIIEGKTFEAGVKLLERELRGRQENGNIAFSSEFISPNAFDSIGGTAFMNGDRIKTGYALNIAPECETDAKIDQVQAFYAKHLFPITSMLYNKYLKIAHSGDQLLYNPTLKKDANGVCNLSYSNDIADLENAQEHKVRDFYEKSGWAGLYMTDDNVGAWTSEIIANAQYGVPRLIKENAEIFSKRMLVADVPPTFGTNDLSYYKSQEGTWFKFKKIFGSNNREIGTALVESTSGRERYCYARIHGVTAVPTNLQGLSIPAQNPNVNSGVLDPNRWYSLFANNNLCKSAEAEQKLLIESVNISDGYVVTTDPYILKAKVNSPDLLSKIEFYADGKLIASAKVADSAGYYSAVWKTRNLRSATVKVKAFDKKNVSTEISKKVTVRIKQTLSCEELLKNNKTVSETIRKLYCSTKK